MYNIYLNLGAKTKYDTMVFLFVDLCKLHSFSWTWVHGDINITYEGIEYFN